MSVPKSVVRFRKGGVEYTSNVDFACYTIVELTRAALRDVGKFIVRTANTGAMKLPGLSKSRRVRGRTSAFLYNVPWAKTGLPHLEVGVAHDTWYGAEQEMGSSRMPKHGILRNSAHDNIAKIIEIESKYLSALEDEARALSLIDEGEYTGGADD
jgi:HK97 gp10 family phage protein